MMMMMTTMPILMLMRTVREQAMGNVVHEHAILIGHDGTRCTGGDVHCNATGGRLLATTEQESGAVAVGTGRTGGCGFQD